MKRISQVFVFIVAINNFLIAQTNDNLNFRLTTATNDIGFSILLLRDPYLSPYAYSGLGLNYEHIEQKLFNPTNPKISMEGKFSTLVGLGINPVSTASMIYVGGNYSWGAYYHFNPIQDLEILTGANTSIHLAYKTIGRNINNPINVDIATQLNLSAIARRKIHTRKKKTLLLSLKIESPLAGCMFVPYSGASYYEMFEVGNLSNTIHFSSLHNRLAFSESMFLDVPTKNSTLSFGFKISNLKYEANHLVFINQQTSINIGWKYNFHVFRGTKNLAPENFKTSYL